MMTTKKGEGGLVAGTRAYRVHPCRFRTVYGAIATTTMYHRRDSFRPVRRPVIGADGLQNSRGYTSKSTLTLF
jgi:hypothetical protein